MANLTDTFYAGEAIVGYGAQWLIGDGASPENFEAVADVISIAFGDMTTAVIEKTHLRSPAAHREKKVTLRDSGPFTMKCNYRPTHESQNNAGGGTGSFTTGGILAKWIGRSELNMKIKLNDGSPATELPFRGSITKDQPGEIMADGKTELTVEGPPLQ